MNINEGIENVINKFTEIGNTIADAQEKFADSKLYDIFNSALDVGIKIALPDVVEDIAIDIKDTLLENGLLDGAKQIWNNVKEFGKSAFGIVSGKFDNIEQIQMAVKTGGVLDITSKIFDFALENSVKSGKIDKSTRQKLKNTKNSIIKDIKNKISESIDNQVTYIERINDYNEKWNNCFENQDLKGMKNANKNIQKYLEKVIPLENVLKNARKVEMMQNIVENTGRFELTQEEKELVEAFSY